MLHPITAQATALSRGTAPCRDTAPAAALCPVTAQATVLHPTTAPAITPHLTNSPDTAHHHATAVTPITDSPGRATGLLIATTPGIHLNPESPSLSA